MTQRIKLAVTTFQVTRIILLKIERKTDGKRQHFHGEWQPAKIIPWTF